MFEIFFTKPYELAVENIIQSFPASLHYAKVYLLTGGKQLRPRLYFEMCTHLQVAPDINVAISLELLHNYFLIHDDIMDQDETRRGKNTLHTEFAKKYSPHKAMSLALMIGDAVANAAYKHLAQSAIDPQLKAEFYIAVDQTIQGQTHEFLNDHIPTLEGLQTWYIKKTAYYSIYLPLILAHIQISNDKDNLLEFSKLLGLLYQMHNDAEEYNNPKEISTDLQNLKVTPILLLFLADTPELKPKIMNGEVLTPEEYQKYLQIILSKNLPHFSLKSVHQLYEKAQYLALKLGIQDIQSIKHLLQKFEIKK